MQLNCMVCGAEFLGRPPVLCCSGKECGCMGLPIDPIICTQDCYDTLLNKDTKKNDNE